MIIMYWFALSFVKSDGSIKLQKAEGNFISVTYAKRLFQKDRAGSCTSLLGIRLPFTVQSASDNLSPFKDLIFKDLLCEQFFPTKPGTQVQL